MEQTFERVAGLDVHQGSVVACVLIAEPGRRKRKEIQTFGTMGAQLDELWAWLQEHRVTHVLMEGTGIYWIPVYRKLEGAFDLTVGNARHIKNVPGRKTDVQDAAWLAQLHAHGLVRKSFVPPAEVRRLRDFTRYRVTLVQDRAAACNRLLKQLESMGIKLASVVSDVQGATGRAIVKALCHGEEDTREMAELARGALRKKRSELALALSTPIEPSHRMLLTLAMQHIELLDGQIAKLDECIAHAAAPFQEQIELLCTAPGLDHVSATAIVAECGVDMAAFPNEHHLASWCGVAPGQHQSGGKKQTAPVSSGNPYTRRVLVQAGWAAARTKGSYLRDKFHRLKSRRGTARALIAIAHKLVVSAYHMLRDRVPYRDLGATYLDQLDVEKTRSRLVARLRDLGVDVILTPRASANISNPETVAEEPG